MRELRLRRINAEITDLQTRLRNNGYTLGEPFDPETIPSEHLEWIARIWYLGFAKHRLDYVV